MKMLIVAAVAIAALTTAGLASARTDSPARAAATTVSVRGKEFSYRLSCLWTRSRGPRRGVVVDARGDVVTNAHVVANATQFVVTLASGDSHLATAIGRDAAHDIARPQ